MHARRTLLLLVTLWSVGAQAQSGPMPLWNDGPAKKAIVDFVRRVSTSGAPDYVPPAQRVAVFDHDGTLWAEQPVYFPLLFAAERVQKLAPKHPEWKKQKALQIAITGDIEALRKLGKTEILQITSAAGDGMKVDDYMKAVRQWVIETKHPQRPQRIGELAYKPMVELINYLKQHEFKVYIVTGGDLEFTRAIAEAIYNVPRENVVGTAVVTDFSLVEGKPVLKRTKEIVVPVNDGPGKAVNIERYIGLQPIFAFGNSDGDLQMLQFTTGQQGPSLALLLHHDDAEREWAYDRNSPVGHLSAALDEAQKAGWTVVSMKKDFVEVFPKAE